MGAWFSSRRGDTSRMCISYDDVWTFCLGSGFACLFWNGAILYVRFNMLQKVHRRQNTWNSKASHAVSDVIFASSGRKGRIDTSATRFRRHGRQEVKTLYGWQGGATSSALIAENKKTTYVLHLTWTWDYAQVPYSPCHRWIPCNTTTVFVLKHRCR